MSSAAHGTIRVLLENTTVFFDDICRYLFAIVLVFLGNSLVCTLPGVNGMLRLMLLALCVVILMMSWRKIRISERELGYWVVWILIVFMTYLCVLIATGDGNGARGVLSMGFLMLCPMMITLLIKNGMIEKYLRAIVNVIAILAAISLVLWVAGPVFGVIPSNCSIPNGWTGSEKSVLTQGYFHLLYIVQSGEIFGASVVRNTGVFVEGPMYSYTLCIAIIFETFFSRRPRKLALIILYTTVISTLTTTGILFVLILGFIEFVRYMRNLKSDLRPLLLILLGVLFVSLITVAFFLFNQKMSTSSGVIRLDDFYAGFAAWLSSPVYGHGLGNTDAVVTYMSNFRLHNVGFSNSPFDLLARGGLVFAVPFIMAAFGFLHFPNRLRVAFLLFVCLWIVTLVTFLPLTYFMFSFGAAGLFFDRESGAYMLHQKGTAE